MAIIIGSEEAGGAELAMTLEKGYATKRVAAKTGKLAKLALKVTGTSKAETWRLGILKAASSKPSTFIAETETIITPPLAVGVAEGTLSPEIELTEGTEYFLCALPLTGATGKTTATTKTGWGFKSAGAITKISEGVYSGTLNTFGEPAPIWGIEGITIVNVAGTTKVKLQASDAVSALLSTAGTTKLTFKDSAALAAKLAPAGTTKVRFADSAAMLAKILASGTTKVQFVTSANVSSGEEEAEARTIFMIFEDF